MADNTEITYDVSQAVGELAKLDNAVEKSARNAEQSFSRTGDASENSEEQVADWIDGVTQGAFALNQVTEAVTAVAGVIYDLSTAIAANTLGFESAANASGDFIDKMERVLQIANSLAGVQDSAASFQFTRALEDLRLEQSGRGVRLGEIGQERATLQLKLREQQQYFNQLDKIADASAKKRQDLEKKATDLRARIQDRQTIRDVERFNPNQQVAKLLEAADKLSKQGNFDRAENLLDEALSRAQGNRFNTRRVDAGFEQLANDIEKAARAAGTKEAADRTAADAAKAVADATRARVDALVEEAAALALVNKLEKERQRTLQLGAAAEGRRQTRAEGSREAAAAIAELQNVANAQRGVGEQLLSSFQGLFTGDLLLPGEEFDEQVNSVKLLDQALTQLQSKLGKGATLADFEEAGPQIQAFVAALAELRGNDSLADFLQPDLERFSKAEEILNRMADAVAKQRQGGADASTQLIDPSTQRSAVDVSRETGAIQSDLEKAQQGAKILADRYKEAAANASQVRLPATGTGINPIAPVSPNQAQPSAPVRTQQNINVSANIQGGMLDQATMRQITDLIQREIRKGTA